MEEETGVQGELLFEAAPATEVDELRWLPLSRAIEELTWDGDRQVVAALADAV